MCIRDRASTGQSLRAEEDIFLAKSKNADYRFQGDLDLKYFRNFSVATRFGSMETVIYFITIIFKLFCYKNNLSLISRALIWAYISLTYYNSLCFNQVFSFQLFT